MIQANTTTTGTTAATSTETTAQTMAFAKTTTLLASETTPLSASSLARQQQQRQQLQQTLKQSNVIKTKVIRKHLSEGFGFSLRHFIAYLNEEEYGFLQEKAAIILSALPIEFREVPTDTIFVSEVHPNSPAQLANIKEGDRILMVNNIAIMGYSYSTVISMIKATPALLTLHVLDKAHDLLQLYYGELAHSPESNLTMAYPLAKTNRVQTDCTDASISCSNLIQQEQPQYQQQRHSISLMPAPPLPASTLMCRQGMVSSRTAAAAIRALMQQSSSSKAVDSFGYIDYLPTEFLGNLIHDGDNKGSVQPGPQYYLQKQRQLQHQQQEQWLHFQQRQSKLQLIQNQRQQRLHGLNSGYSSLPIMPNDSTSSTSKRNTNVGNCSSMSFRRSNQPPNLKGIPGRGQHLSDAAIPLKTHSDIAATVTPATDNSDFMVRLRESIKQKEEFLKSPATLTSFGKSNNSHELHIGDGASTSNQYFFPNSPALAVVGPQLIGQQESIPAGSVAETAAVSFNCGPITSTPRVQHQRTISRHPSASANSGARAMTANDLGQFHLRITNSRTGSINNASPESLVSCANKTCSGKIEDISIGDESAQLMLDHKHQSMNAVTITSTPLGSRNTTSGFTNKFFERKHVPNVSIGFDPFKPLSINISGVITEAVSSNPPEASQIKNAGVLNKSLQLHPLHQIKHQVHSETLHQSVVSVVDGQASSRGMDIPKVPTRSTNLFAQQSEKRSAIDKTSAMTQVLFSDIGENVNPASYIRSSLIGGASKSTEDSLVVRRFRSLSSSVDEMKPMRRISYLRATNNESDSQVEDPLTLAASHDQYRQSIAAVGATMLETENAMKTGTAITASPVTSITTAISTTSTDLNQIAHGFVEENVETTCDVIEDCHNFIGKPNSLVSVYSTMSELRNSTLIEKLSCDFNEKLVTKDKDDPEMKIFATEMEIKASFIRGKRVSEYRSWRQVKIEIHGDVLKIYSNRHTKSGNNVIELDIRNFKFFDESVDKKKYIFRMKSKPTHFTTLGNELNFEFNGPVKPTSFSNSGNSSICTAGDSSNAPALPLLELAQHTEILFKTKNSIEMKRILGLLQWKNSLVYEDNGFHGKSLTDSQRTAPYTCIPTTRSPHSDEQSLEHCPPLIATDARSSAGNRNNTYNQHQLGANDSISPMMKARKSTSHKYLPDKDLGSPKSKNWKDLLFRRGGGSGHHHTDITPAKLIGSIGVPLKYCPMSTNNEFVPHLVDICTNIVETRGLSVVGIYRIPGNKAAISELSEQVNKADFSWEYCNTDIRWEDVNVVSSLLKLFIRSLPDALLPTSFYNNFIEADKKTGLARLKDLKDLLQSLPRHSYETMKHLIRHLNRVSKNCEANRMEPKNLAIIFGPSIIRTPNDTLEIAVKDMKHQCRIVELLVTQYEYFFENGSTPEVADICGAASGVSEALGTVKVGESDISQSQADQTNLLLHNVAKIERLAERENRTSRFIPQLRRRTHSKRSAVSSDTYSGESVLSLDCGKPTLNSPSTCINATNSYVLQSRNSSRSSPPNVIQTAIDSISNVPTTMSEAIEMTVEATDNISAKTVISTAFDITKKKEHARSHHRKSSLDEKDSRSCINSDGICTDQHSSIHIDDSMSLTGDESSNSRVRDSGSMSLATITDTLDIKLRNLRSDCEINEENGAPSFPKNRRHTLGLSLHMHSENIPYADESPDCLFHAISSLEESDALMLSRSCAATNVLLAPNHTNIEICKHNKESNDENTWKNREKIEKQITLPRMCASVITKGHKLQHSATVPIISLPLPQSATNNSATSTAAVLALKTSLSTLAGPISCCNTLTANVTSANIARMSTAYGARNTRYNCGGIGYGRNGSEDDSEGSTTSDPKESAAIIGPSTILDHFNKRRRDHRLFRSASFNCRNYLARHTANSTIAHSTLTKDEKTDMNLTKKRQLQDKQNRSIKRRHTVGGAHDYSSTNKATVSFNEPSMSINSQLRINDRTLTGLCRSPVSTTTVRRVNTSRNGNSCNSSSTLLGRSNYNNSTQVDTINFGQADSDVSNINNRNSTSNNTGSGTEISIVSSPTQSNLEHLVDVTIRVKNINRARFLKE